MSIDPEAAVRYLAAARLAPAEELLADPPRRISDQDRGERIGSAIGWSVVALLCVLGVVHVAHVYGIGPGLARVAGWVASFFR